MVQQSPTEAPLPTWAGILIGSTLGLAFLAFGFTQCKAARKRGLKELKAQGHLLPHKEAKARGPSRMERRTSAFNRTMQRLRTLRFNLSDVASPRGSTGRKSSSGSGGRRPEGRRTSAEGLRRASAPARLGRGSSVAPTRGLAGRIPSFEELGRASMRR